MIETLLIALLQLLFVCLGLALLFWVCRLVLGALGVAVPMQIQQIVGAILLILAVLWVLNHAHVVHWW